LHQHCLATAWHGADALGDLKPPSRVLIGALPLRPVRAGSLLSCTMTLPIVISMFANWADGRSS
jgi:hypothetical protein